MYKLGYELLDDAAAEGVWSELRATYGHYSELGPGIKLFMQYINDSHRCYAKVYGRSGLEGALHTFLASSHQFSTALNSPRQYHCSPLFLTSPLQSLTSALVSHCQYHQPSPVFASPTPSPQQSSLFLASPHLPSFLINTIISPP